MKRARLLLFSAVIAALAVFVARGGVRLTDRPVSLVIGTAMGTAVLAVMSIWLGIGRNGSMVGRPRLSLITLVLAAPLTLLLWKVLWSMTYEHALDRWPTRVGFRCLTLSLTMGILPLFAVLVNRRGTDPTHPELAGLAAGSAVGICTAALVDLWCPVAYVPHLLLGHVLPCMILASTGFLLGHALRRSS